jgi:gliding motility-associated-like protein
MKNTFIYFGFIILFFNIQLQAQTFQLNTIHSLSASGRGDFICVDIDNDDFTDVIFSGINDISARVTIAYRNNGDGTFTNFGAAFPPLSDGSLAVGDVNNDGLIDVFINGTNNAGVRQSKLFMNQGAGVFTVSNFTFEGLSFGQSKMEDVNNDGRIDILATGISTTNVIKTLIYVNDGNDQFTSISHGIVGVNNGSMVAADFNKDGYIDVIVSGLNNVNQRVTDLYINNKDETFSRIEAGLPTVRSGAMAAGDYNSDGFIDLFVSGNKTGGTVISEIYTSNSGSGFILDASLPPLEQSAAAWGDYDHDGDLDIAISGFEDPDFKTYLYENIGTGFTNSGIAFPGLIDGNINWTDYDGNNKLDLIISGYSSLGVITNVYENISLSTNTAPVAPTSLAAVTNGDTVTLSWNQALDTETGSAGLSYSVYIGSNPATIDALSPRSNISNGFRRIIESGRNRTNLSVNSLPEGIYYWSVQTIDNGFVGSDFAVEKSFTICYPISIGQDTSLCVGETLHLELGTVSDVVDWYSKKQGLLAAGSNSIDFLIAEDDSIFVELTNVFGCLLKDTLAINALALPIIDLGADLNECTGTTINLDAGNPFTVIAWSSAKDGVLGSAQQISYLIDQKDTISIEVKDANMCVNSDTLMVAALSLPNVNLGADQTICFGENVILEVVADSVNWRTTVGFEIINSSIFQRAVNVKDTVMVEIFDLATNCSNSDTVIVDFFELPLADAGSDKVTCPETSVEIGGDYSNINGLTFLWNQANTLNNSNTANPLASPSIETTYTLTVIDGNACQNSDSVMVMIDSPSIIDSGIDRDICIGASTELGGTPTASGSQLTYTFSWTPASVLNDATVPNPMATPTETTTYKLITSTLNCILDTSFVTVTVNALPVVTVDPEVTTIGLGQSVNLTASGGEKYEWTPVNGLNDPNIANPDASPQETTTYTVDVTNINGCMAAREVKVIVKNQVFVPELFTPNGDFNNDTFNVYGEGFETLTLRIYDRNSKLIFESSDLSEIKDSGWDGKKEGVLQESGSYVWVIAGTFFDGSPILYKGKSSGILKLIR